jgi:hypothetical protein
MTSVLVPKQEQQSTPDPFDWFPIGMANAVINPATGESLEYQQLIKRDIYCKTWLDPLVRKRTRQARSGHP